MDVWVLGQELRQEAQVDVVHLAAGLPPWSIHVGGVSTKESEGVEVCGGANDCQLAKFLVAVLQLKRATSTAI